ncbi:MAG: nucleotidyltransferase family protein, partial [Mariprofundales bacterium]|nr:nucleotidyltransferase family protein [Mariprofundales bacterium]
VTTQPGRIVAATTQITTDLLEFNDKLCATGSVTIKPDRAVILAAGLGTRLRWLTTTRPKALMPIGGEAAIIHTIRHLTSFGVRHIAINIHHHGEQIAQLLGDGRRFGVTLYYSREGELLDSGGGVRRACSLLPAGEHLLIHNGDVVSDIDLHQLWSSMQTGHAAATLALVANPPHNPAGDFTLNSGVVGKRDSTQRSWTYSGVSLWSQAAVTDDRWGERFSLLKPMLELLRCNRLYGIIHHSQWHDIGRPKELFATIKCRR